MMSIMSQGKSLWLLFLIALVSPASHGDELGDAEKAELARQEAFRAGIERIVADFNTGSFYSLIRAIDRDDMVDRIFGLRLIDQKIKRQFNESLEYGYDAMIKSSFVEPESGLKATLLGVESRGDRGRAVVRFDEPKFKFRYHEYDLRLDADGRLVVVDWTDFLNGMQFSESIGRSLVMGAPSAPNMRKLLDFQDVKDRDLFMFGELLKAARDRRLDRYLEIREGLEPRFQRQRIVVESSVLLARQVRQRRKMLAALEIMAEYFPDEPLYSLMLLDYYFPRKKYEEGFRALQLLSERLGVEDAVMDARFSTAALSIGNVPDALAYVDRALEREPDLELAWWTALNVRAEQADFAGCVEALQTLEGEFGYDLGPDTLRKNPAYAQLLQSDAFKAWKGSAE